MRTSTILEKVGIHLSIFSHFGYKYPPLLILSIYNHYNSPIFTIYFLSLVLLVVGVFVGLSRSSGESVIQKPVFSQVYHCKHFTSFSRGNYFASPIYNYFYTYTQIYLQWCILVLKYHNIVKIRLYQFSTLVVISNRYYLNSGRVNTSCQTLAK